MSASIRYPNITAAAEKEQIAQIKSYLHQLVDQLNYALTTMSSNGSEQAGAEKTYEVQGGEMSYYELRSLIIQELQEVKRLFEQLSGQYVKSEELSAAIDTALLRAKESGDFKGDPGDTPVKGEDYFTPQEVNDIAKQAAGKISFSMDENGYIYYELEE